MGRSVPCWSWGQMNSEALLAFTLAEILVEISGVHNQDSAEHFHLSQ